ncbi:MAG: hypothetical protein Q7R96_02135 [Nanoarchaeota archaeon]|nr:hypothetical protein [Nanoarchaeota archaeon]
MEPEKYRELRDLFFAARNTVEEPIQWLAYHFVLPVHAPLGTVYDVAGLLEGQRIKRKGNVRRTLWNLTIQGGNYKVYDELTAAVAAGEFTLERADIHDVSSLSSCWNPRQAAARITSSIVLLPKDKEKYRHYLRALSLLPETLPVDFEQRYQDYGFIRTKHSRSLRDDPGIVQDLQELDAFFHNE